MYACTMNVCYVYAIIDPNVITRLYMCVERMYVYVYAITDLDVATRKCMYVYMYVSESVIILLNQILQCVSMYSVNFHS